MKEPGCCEKRDYAQDRKTAFWLWILPLSLAILGFVFGSLRNCIWPLALAWMGIACVVNAKSCGRVHCTFTGPLYLLIAIVGICAALGVVNVSWIWLWATAILGTLLSFVPEWAGKKYWL